MEKFKLDNVQKETGRAVMVATLEDHKDHATLLEAWRRVEKENSTVRLVIAGDGSLAKKLHEMATRLGLSTVEFAGSVKDVPRLLNESEVFILSTTVQEGFGTVLIEALASGCKVVATDVPACREVLQNGRFGKLVHPNNPSHLASAILETFRVRITQDQLTNQVRFAESFSPAKMIAAYMEAEL